MGVAFYPMDVFRLIRMDFASTASLGFISTTTNAFYVILPVQHAVIIITVLRAQLVIIGLSLTEAYVPTVQVDVQHATAQETVNHA